MIELIAKIALVLVLIVCAALETWFDGHIKGFADGFAAAREFWRPLCHRLIDENEALKRKLKESGKWGTGNEIRVRMFRR